MCVMSGPGGDTRALGWGRSPTQGVRCFTKVTVVAEVCSLLPPCCSVVHHSPAAGQTRAVQGTVPGWWFFFTRFNSILLCNTWVFTGIVRPLVGLWEYCRRWSRIKKKKMFYCEIRAVPKYRYFHTVYHDTSSHGTLSICSQQMSMFKQ